MGLASIVLVAALATLCVAQSDGRYRPVYKPTTPSPYKPYKPYKPTNFGRYTGYSGNDGRYNGGDDGRYRGGDDGRYRPDGAGAYKEKYIHDAREAEGYKHIDAGYKGDKDDISKYRGDNDKYKYQGDNDKYVGGGQYNGDKDKNVGGGQYNGDKDKNVGGGQYQGDKNAGQGAGSGNKYPGSGTGSLKPTTGTTKPVSGAGSGSGSTRPHSFDGKPSGTGSQATGIKPAAGYGKPVEGKRGNAAGFYENTNYAIIRKVEQTETDGYNYAYETANGITGEEQGKVHNAGTDDEGMKSSGFYTYTGPDNIVYTMTYTADERGFVPQGDHIPTPPPIPEAIARMLEWQRQQGTL